MSPQTDDGLRAMLENPPPVDDGLRAMLENPPPAPTLGDKAEAWGKSAVESVGGMAAGIVSEGGLASRLAGKAMPLLESVAIGGAGQDDPAMQGIAAFFADQATNLERGGQAISEATRAKGLHPELEGSFAHTMVPGAIASAGSFMVGGVGARLAGMGPRMAIAALGMVTEGGSVYQDAVAHGASDEKAITAGLIGTGLGATEALGVGKIFSRIDKETKGALMRAFVNGWISEVPEEALQEGFQASMETLIAQNIYDEEREFIWNDVLKQAAAGGLAAMFFSSLGTAYQQSPLGPGAEEAPRKPPEPVAPPEVSDVGDEPVAPVEEQPAPADQAELVSQRFEALFRDFGEFGAREFLEAQGEDTEGFENWVLDHYWGSGEEADPEGDVEEEGLPDMEGAPPELLSQWEEVEESGRVYEEARRYFEESKDPIATEMFEKAGQALQGQRDRFGEAHAAWKESGEVFEGEPVPDKKPKEIEVPPPVSEEERPPEVGEEPAPEVPPIAPEIPPEPAAVSGGKVRAVASGGVEEKPKPKRKKKAPKGITYGKGPVIQRARRGEMGLIEYIRSRGGLKWTADLQRVREAHDANDIRRQEIAAEIKEARKRKQPDTVERLKQERKNLPRRPIGMGSVVHAEGVDKGSSLEGLLEDLTETGWFPGSAEDETMGGLTENDILEAIEQDLQHPGYVEQAVDAQQIADDEMRQAAELWYAQEEGFDTVEEAVSFHEEERRKAAETSGQEAGPVTLPTEPGMFGDQVKEPGARKRGAEGKVVQPNLLDIQKGDQKGQETFIDDGEPPFARRSQKGKGKHRRRGVVSTRFKSRKVRKTIKALEEENELTEPIEAVKPETADELADVEFFKRLGAKVIFVDRGSPLPNAPAVTSADRSLVVLDVQTPSRLRRVSFVLHEAVHVVGEKRLYRALNRAFPKLMAEMRAGYQARTGRELSAEDLNDEGVAFLAENLPSVLPAVLSSPQKITELAKQDMSLLERLATVLSRLLRAAGIKVGDPLRKRLRAIQAQLAQTTTEKGLDPEELFAIAETIADAFKAAAGETQAKTEVGRPKYAAAPDDLGFYSPLEGAVEGFGKKVQVSQLRALVKKGKVKAEEWEWAEMDAFLEGKESVSKEDLVAHIAQHNTVVTEKVLGEAPERMGPDEYVEKLQNMDTPELAEEAWAILGMDRDEVMEEDDHEGTIDELVEAYDDPSSRAWDHGEPTRHESFQLPGGENYREVLLTLPGGTYTHEHYADTPGILAHVRTNERTLPDGRSVLFLEEVQSDLHQEGRKKGYIPGRDGTWDVFNVRTGHVYRNFPTADEAKAFLVSPEGRELPGIDWAPRGSGNVGGEVPDAPFKTTWHELALKRMVRWASEHGFDGLGWTTGDAQETRYWSTAQDDPGMAAWREVGKPESLREKLLKHLGPELNAVASLEVVDASMLPMLQHKEVVLAVIEAIPVDVVNVLSGKGLSAEQLIRNPKMVGKALAVDRRPAVVEGLGDALHRVGARLRAALDGVLAAEPARGDEEVLPALRASDLSAREVVGMLAPKRLYGLDRDVSLSRLRGARARAKPTLSSRDDAGKRGEPSATELASLLNRHAAIVADRTGKVKQNFVIPPGEGMRGFYDKMLPIAANKLGKKHGARVGVVALERAEPDLDVRVEDVNGAWAFVVRDGGEDVQESSAIYLSEEAAARAGNEAADSYAQRAKAAAIGDVHYLPITDSLREAAVREGFPRFARQGEFFEGKKKPQPPIIAQAELFVDGLPEAPDPEQIPDGKNESPAMELLMRWIGRRQEDQEEANIRAAEHEEELRKLVGRRTLKETAKETISPEPSHRRVREADQAMQVYIDLLDAEEQGHGTPQEQIEKFGADITEQQRRLYEASQALSPEIKALAEKIAQENGLIAIRARAAGVLKQFRQFYSMRLWAEQEGDGEKRVGWGRFTLQTARTKRRTFESVLEGWSLGRELRIKGAISAQQMSAKQLTQVIHDRNFLEMGIKAGVFSTEDQEGFVKLDHANFRKPAVVGKIEEGKVYGRDHWVDDDGNLWQMRPVFARKKTGDRLNRTLGRSKLYDLWGVTKLTKYNAIFKHTILFTSLFHHQAFLRSFGLGVPLEYSLTHTFRPWTSYQEGAKAIRNYTPELRALVKAGLTIGRIQDFDEAMSTEKTWIGEQIDKVPMVRETKNAIVKMRDQQTNFLFHRMGPNLKVMNALLEYRHLLRKHRRKIERGDMTVEDVARLAAEVANADFGGLNLEREGRSPEAQHIFRLLALAPDWTESNVRSMVRAFKGRIEGHVYRALWGRVLLRAGVATVLFNTLMAWLDDDRDLEDLYVDAWKAGKEKGGWRKLRWLSVDVTPLVKKAAPSVIEEGEHKYFSILGHFRDPIKFVVDPLTSAKHKGSVVSSMAAEAMQGQDWAGRNFTSFSELMGLDDRGTYKTSKKNPDGSWKFRKGDPKGGKWKGKTVAWQWGEKGGPLEWTQVPSFVGSQSLGITPIQVQNLVAWLMGEIDGFDALTKSLGLMTATTYPPKEKD